MMLSTFLPSTPQRYAIAGSAVGAVIPLFIFSVETALAGGGFDWTLPVRDATHIFMSLFPLICGVVFYRIGLMRAQLAVELGAALAAGDAQHREARRDRLTGLSNRTALEEEMAALLAARARGRLRPAVLLIDIDRFKYVNDTLGHDAGDALLIGIAQRLSAVSGPLCRLFRLGGDEFVITVAGVPGEDEIGRLCEAIRSSLSQPFDIRGSHVETGASIGITFMESDDDRMGQVLKRADLALYKAKAMAGSSHVFFTPDLGEQAFARQTLERDLARAIEHGELFLEFQPIVSSVTGQVQSFEALVRWRHPRLGILPPRDFIGGAGRSGQMLTIGKWVLETACRQASRWPETYSLAVNVAVDQFKDRGFADYVLATLAATGLAPARLTLEITETLFSMDGSIIAAGMQRLRAAGVRFALDDFGVGLSSIAHLRAFPVDVIKIDRSFAAAMLDNRRDADLVDLIVRLSGAFNAQTTVEGIETDDQLALARQLGAGQIQGFLISRPLSAEAVDAIIAEADGAHGKAGRLTA